MGILSGGFANLAARALGSIYLPAQVISETDPVLDDGGSIIDPGTVVRRDCRAQVDVATWQMKQSAGYVAGSMRVFILAATLDGGLNTDARIEMLEGPHAGVWEVSGLEMDAAGSYWLGTGVGA